MSHFKVIPGLGKGSMPINLSFQIQDDLTVPGYGTPITMELCRQIVLDYHLEQKKVYDKINTLPNTSDLQELKLGLSPEKEIVAGIYGRDTLMHILEQPGCEGIMYINCIFENEKSIVLLGVDKDGKPIGGVEQFQKDERSASGDAVLYEVKGGKKTRQEILNLIDAKPQQEIKSTIFSALF